MSPNPRGKLEDLAAVCVCYLVVCVPFRTRALTKSRSKSVSRSKST